VIKKKTLKKISFAIREKIVTFGVRDCVILCVTECHLFTN